MLTSIMFWGVPKDPAEQKMDLGKSRCHDRASGQWVSHNSRGPKTTFRFKKSLEVLTEVRNTIMLITEKKDTIKIRKRMRHMGQGPGETRAELPVVFSQGSSGSGQSSQQ